MVPLLDIPFLEALLLAGLAMSAGYYLIALRGARDFFRCYRAPRGTPGSQPPISILKPLKGPEPHLYENLASLCRQRYGTFQIVCGVANPDDSAIGTVRRLQADFPQADIELVVDPTVYGTNYKVSNVENLYRHAKYDVIVIADSDIRVGPEYLRRIAVQVTRPQTGLVTCLYRAVHTGGLPSLVESLFINTDFTAMVLVARQVEQPTYAFGATIALRREVLEQAGGFLPLASYLADDYQLGNRIARLGYDLVLSDEVVDNVVAVPGWRSLLQHELRWARTYRVCRPTGFFFTILTHGTLWALLHLAYQGMSTGSCLVAAGLIGLRSLCAALLAGRYLRARFRMRELPVLWAKDLLLSAVWLLAFAGNTVSWHGRRFRILRNGEMLDLSPGAPSVEAWDTALAAAARKPRR